MKNRILSLATMLICGLFSTASALTVTSQAITQFKISQTRFSEDTPFIIRGKIWGSAPIGEVNRILYRLEDNSQNTLWEFAEPYKKTFSEGDQLDAEFEFDFSDVLIGGDSDLIVELQYSSMNGSFAQTLAVGKLNIVFPEAVKEDLVISEITKFATAASTEEIKGVVSFINNGEQGTFLAEVKVFDAQGLSLSTKRTDIVTLEKGEKHDFEVSFTSPPKVGLYELHAQVLSKQKPVTGISKKTVTIKGDFGVLSDLRITPSDFLYAGDVATVEFTGAISAVKVPLNVHLKVTNKAGTEVFASKEEMNADQTGRFSGSASFVIPEETSELKVSAELLREGKALWNANYRTGIYKKLSPSAGQSEISFQAEQVKQEFETGTLFQKLGMILLLIGILAVAALFVWLVMKTRRAAPIAMFLLATCGMFSVAHAGNVIISNQPIRGWTVAPNSSVEDALFRQLHFSGIVELGVSGHFPEGSDIDYTVNFMSDPETVVQAVTGTFQTPYSNKYDFIIEVPNTLDDGEYALQLVIGWAGMSSNPLFSDGEPLTIILMDGIVPLTIKVDKTSPVTNLGYFQYKDGAYQEIPTGGFSNTPVHVSVGCDDVNAGCIPGVDDKFEVNGNFCAGDTFCETGKIDTYVLCDQVGNCAQPGPLDIRHYDPVAPVATGVEVSGEVGGIMSALKSYILDIVGLNDPAEGTFPVDADACGGEDSPFFRDEADGVCKERLKICGLTASTRGILDQSLAVHTCTEDCPEGMDKSPWGTCEPCSTTNFPYCFDWQLEVKCETFPFCFEMTLQ